MILVSILFSISLNCGAVSFHSPSSPDELAAQERLKKELSDIAVKHTDYESALRNWNERPIDRDDYEDEQLKEHVLNLQKQETILQNQAIHSAIVAFGIAPDQPAGTLLIGGQFKGAKATWIPVYGKMEPRWFQDANGQSKLITPDDKELDPLDPDVDLRPFISDENAATTAIEAARQAALAIR